MVKVNHSFRLSPLQNSSGFGWSLLLMGSCLVGCQYPSYLHPLMPTQVKTKLIVRWQFGSIFCILLFFIHFPFLFGKILRVLALNSARQIIHISIFIPLNQRLKVSGVNVIIDIPIIIRHGGILRRESPLTINNKLIPKNRSHSY